MVNMAVTRWMAALESLDRLVKGFQTVLEDIGSSEVKVHSTCIGKATESSFTELVKYG